MDILQAAILGALQGATEFLPISSSAHLIIVPAVLGWQAPLTFDVVVHVATGLAVLAYFRDDWVKLLGGAWRGLRAGDPWADPDARLLILLVIASIPVAIAGLLFRGAYEQILGGDLTAVAREAGGQLILNGMMLIPTAPMAGSWAWRRARSVEAMGATEPEDVLRPHQAVIIGLAQAVSLLPGISRSGATIVAGQFFGLTRERAARFSFLLGTPAILGAGLVQAAEAAATATPPAPGEVAALVVGFVAAFAVGWISIDWLLAYLRRAPMVVFAVYCWLLGMATIWWFW